MATTYVGFRVAALTLFIDTERFVAPTIRLIQTANAAKAVSIGDTPIAFGWTA